jgi:phosphatidate cytidylyltransferase
VSPGKTWEGAVGGLVGAVGASFILALIFEEWGTGLPLTYWHIALLASLIGIFAQLGDLLESGLKRITQVKNSGRCLPGHGGILDRLDSIIFTGVVVYYYVTWFAA